MQLILNKIRTNYQILKEDRKKQGCIIFLGMVFIVIIILFHKYLTGRVFHIYKDWSGDSIQQIWPRLIYLSRCLEERNIPSWSFSQKIGAKDAIRNVFDYMAVLGGTNFIPYALSYLYIFKIFVGGFFFYKYSFLMNESQMGAIISGFFYSFCSPMMLRGGWRGYPNEIMMVAILLYISECYVRGKYKRLFPIFVAIFSFTVDAYYACFYTVVFTGYAFWRYFGKGWNKINFKEFLAYEITYFIGFLLAIRNVSNLIYDMMYSGRVAYEKGNMGDSIFSLQHLPLDFMSSISPCFFGTNDTRYTNILSGPEFYCGILSILLFSQVMCIKNKVNRNWYFGMIVLVGVYCAFPGIRALTTLGRSSAYKASAFWIIPVLLTIFCSIWKQLEDKNISQLLFNFSCMIVIIIYTFCRICFYRYSINKYDLYLVTLIWGYCLFINLYLVDKINLQLFRKMIVCLCICEVLLFFYDFHNTRDNLTRDDLKTDVFYNYMGNSTSKLINKIKNNDTDLFYRMEQIYLQSNPCDSVAYGYYGIKGYTGGGGSTKCTVDFMRSVNLADEDSTTLIQGWGDNVALNTLMGVKYILSSYDNGMYGYTFMDSAGAIQAYENSNFLSMGYAYDKYLDYDEFMSIPIENRGMALLEGCVLTDDELKQYAMPMDYIPYVHMKDFNEKVYQKNVNERKNEMLDIKEFKEDYIRGTITVSDDKILFFSIPYDRGWKLWVDGKEHPLYCIDNGLMGTYLLTGSHNIEVKWLNPANKYIMVITAMGIMLYICYYVYILKKMKEK